MKRIKIMFMLLASLAIGACSSDDNDNDIKNTTYTETSLSEAPVWQIDWTGNQERPDWTEPDRSIYENWTILMVKLEEALQPYVSEGDMMAIFINGELRGLSKPATNVDTGQTGNATFLMKAYGNETGSETVQITLKYYSQQLKQLFTLSDNIKLNSDESIGIDEDFIPLFTYGSAKYPVVKTVGVETLLAKAGITPVSGNMVGAFVGEECRGKVTLSVSGTTPLAIYGRSEGESLTLKYYDVAKGVLYTIPDAVKM